MTVARNRVASSSSTGAYARVAAASLRMGLPRLGRFPIGDLEQDIGIVGINDLPH